MQVPVVTNSPWRRPSPYTRSSFAIHVKRDARIAEDVGAGAVRRQPAVDERGDRMGRRDPGCASRRVSHARARTSRRTRNRQSTEERPPARSRGSANRAPRWRDEGTPRPRGLPPSSSRCERGGKARRNRNANSASATFMMLPSSGTAAPLSRTRSASSAPASGPSTPMCFWPAALVAAIFQPTTLAGRRELGLRGVSFGAIAGRHSSEGSASSCGPLLPKFPQDGRRVGCCSRHRDIS